MDNYTIAFICFAIGGICKAVLFARILIRKGAKPKARYNYQNK